MKKTKRRQRKRISIRKKYRHFRKKVHKKSRHRRKRRGKRKRFTKKQHAGVNIRFSTGDLKTYPFPRTHQNDCPFCTLAYMGILSCAEALVWGPKFPNGLTDKELESLLGVIFPTTEGYTIGWSYPFYDAKPAFKEIGDGNAAFVSLNRLLHGRPVPGHFSIFARTVEGVPVILDPQVPGPLKNLPDPAGGGTPEAGLKKVENWLHVLGFNNFRILRIRRNGKIINIAPTRGAWQCSPQALTKKDVGDAGPYRAKKSQDFWKEGFGHKKLYTYVPKALEFKRLRQMLRDRKHHHHLVIKDWLQTETDTAPKPPTPKTMKRKRRTEKKIEERDREILIEKLKELKEVKVTESNETMLEAATRLYEELVKEIDEDGDVTMQEVKVTESNEKPPPDSSTNQNQPVTPNVFTKPNPMFQHLYTHNVQPQYQPQSQPTNQNQPVTPNVFTKPNPMFQHLYTHNVQPQYQPQSQPTNQNQPVTPNVFTNHHPMFQHLYTHNVQPRSPTGYVFGQ